MEEPPYQCHHLLLVVTGISTQCTVVIRTQTTQNTVYHGRAEYLMLFKDGTLSFQAIG